MWAEALWGSNTNIWWGVECVKGHWGEETIGVGDREGQGPITVNGCPEGEEIPWISEGAINYGGGWEWEGQCEASVLIEYMTAMIGYMNWIWIHNRKWVIL